jgi:signal transduction histidine kinase/DNA-binding response OmpR family regulator
VQGAKLKPDQDLCFLAGGGEMGERTRAMNWSGTSLGPPSQWPQSLKTAVSICLGSRHPMVLWWGKSAYVQFYNDAYISFLGNEKHPAYLGRSGRDCWSEIWPVVGPMIDSVFDSGVATWSEDLQLILQRRLPREEGYFTFSYSPIREDWGQIGGVFCACYETTERVLGERRLRTLRNLSRTEAETRMVETTCQMAANVLAENSNDIPFALIYLLDINRRQARLFGTSILAAGSAGAPSVIDLRMAGDDESTWPLGKVLESGSVELLRGISGRFGVMPGGSWPEPADSAVILPIAAPGQATPTGFLVAGLSPRRPVDTEYTGFLNLVAAQIGSSIANARSYEEERKRAEALAKLDRAKTLFFSNVSHEFRTPLTLMLGHLEDTLASANLPQEEREKLDTAHRNSLRLLKLVNSLLDFSRIEAGRATANYAPVDLAKLTAELASNFRSLCERAHLGLVVDCPPLREPVYVDRDMWEKIVFNLLSNAFKFTFEGEIVVGLRTANDQAELCIRDTGVGIPAPELPRLFERFHRIEGQKSRTYEGSGIGLALVQELAKLHGGTVSADSAEGRGTTFTVAIPFGRSHLPHERIAVDRNVASTAIRGQAYVEEAMRWLPDAAAPSITVPVPPKRVQAAMATKQEPLLKAARLVVADDNADMREYMRRLLTTHWEVETVSDGQVALDVVRNNRPDLLLTDVMMPRTDGIELLRAIRADPALADLPVILLSARADEDARLQGLGVGADDYLVKPFNARELLARIGTHLKLAELRRERAADLKDMQRLLEVGARCLPAANTFQECLDEILGAAIDILGVDKGTIQLSQSKSGKLTIAAQRGFEGPFLSFFAEVDEQDAAACGRALSAHDRVIVEDVTQSEIFAGSPALDVLLAAGVRSVQSTPLVSSSGHVSGIISTHFAEPHRPTARELRVLDLLARQAADYLERKQDELLRKRAEMRVLGQKHVLEKVATGAPLQETLDSLLLFIEQQEPDIICGLLLTDDCVHFRPGSGPSIPAAYKSGLHEAINTAPNTPPYFATCCEAVQCDKVVLVSDVAQEKNYADAWRELMLASGLRAVRSTPVHASSGRIIGCLALYSFEPRNPNPADDQLVAMATDLASIAIEREKTEITRALLLQELNHRVKNTLASVQAIAQQTVRNTQGPADFAARFSGRIQSLARVHSLLTDSTWRGADLRELIRDQLLQGLIDGTRLRVRGPGVHLDSQTAVHVALMLHELGTNCVKYGALSSSKGWVSIHWTVADNILTLEWTERGGPMVSAPSKRGFGTRLIEHSAKGAGGRARMLSESEGITWTISLPIPDTEASEVLPEIFKPEPASQSAIPKPEIARRNWPLEGLRLLVVEDEPLIRLDLADRLKEAGAHVHTLGTEKDALQTIASEQFDGALLDANLHGRSVNEIAAALTRRNMPFVFITGYGGAGLPTVHQQATVLSKPVTDQQLIDAITRVVKRTKRVVQLKS